MSMHPLVAKRQALALAENTFLLSHGWRHSSYLVEACAFWEKVIPDGRTMLVDKKTALIIEYDIYRQAGD